MPAIETLIPDIYRMLEEEKADITPEASQAFGENLARIIHDKLRPQSKNYLRLSNIGSRCLRRLWYSINTPQYAEHLSGPARIKFLIGDITEAVVLFLAKLAGHDVRDEQQTVSCHGVEGHLDCTLDGEVTDVKSASPYSFKKFKEGVSESTDAFGYLTQLSGYVHAKKSELGHSRGNFLAVDKVLGALCLDRHDDLPAIEADRVEDIRSILAKDEPPVRGFEDEAFGQSGNRKLSLPCSYCEFKERCWPGAKRYDYSNGPVWLTKVVRKPRVPEAT